MGTSQCITEVTLTLPDQLWERAEVLAQRTGREVSELLAETIELGLDPLGGGARERPVDTWPDSEVLAAVETEMPPVADQRLSELLEGQQAAALSTAEQTELRALMQTYQEALLRKARALREAVRRGLRESPAP
jgi:hypothetical protein